MSGIYEKHYKWAKANEEHNLSKALLSFAYLYSKRRDVFTLSMIKECCRDIEEHWSTTHNIECTVPIAKSHLHPNC